MPNCLSRANRARSFHDAFLIYRILYILLKLLANTRSFLYEKAPQVARSPACLLLYSLLSQQNDEYFPLIITIGARWMAAA